MDGKSHHKQISGRIKKRKTSAAFRQYHHGICKIMEKSGTTLRDLTGELFQEGIVDTATKNEIFRQKGYDGADTLMDLVEMKVDANPQNFDTVLQIMHSQDDLQEIVQKMEDNDECEDRNIQSSMFIFIDN